jgi:hypothetical protein
MVKNEMKKERNVCVVKSNCETIHYLEDRLTKFG